MNRTAPMHLLAESKPKPKLEQEPKRQIPIYIKEVLKSFAVKGFEPPKENILLGCAQVMADDLKVIPRAYIPRCFQVARVEISPDPKIFHIMKAWREFVKAEYKESRNQDAPKLAPPEPDNPEENQKAFEDMFRVLYKQGLPVHDDIVKKYNLGGE